MKLVKQWRHVLSLGAGARERNCLLPISLCYDADPMGKLALMS